MALGASRRSVLQLVLSQALRLVVVGLVIGLAGVVAFSRVIRGFLSANTPTNVSDYAVAAAIFLLAALIACLLPARRATAIDPLTALRTE